ncbi:uncharacterized protein LOC126056173 [Helicoverpa armigera]|uniref:uncharacterized protein LOC126056173 n=1 Tax=Helicoverpa armigera TaxID=29058 RepID=UPI0030836ED2
MLSCNRSDSEVEYQSQPGRSAVTEVTKNVQPKKKASKRKTSGSGTTPSESTSSKYKHHSSDLFGLENGELLPATSCGDLGSSLVSRVANGKVRRTADLTGDFYVEVKVYHKAEAASTPREDRWKKASVALKVQINRDSSPWEALQIFMRRTHELFDNSELIFYSDNQIKMDI